MDRLTLEIWCNIALELLRNLRRHIAIKTYIKVIMKQYNSLYISKSLTTTILSIISIQFDKKGSIIKLVVINTIKKTLRGLLHPFYLLTRTLSMNS